MPASPDGHGEEHRQRSSDGNPMTPCHRSASGSPPRGYYRCRRKHGRWMSGHALAAGAPRHDHLETRASGPQGVSRCHPTASRRDVPIMSGMSGLDTHTYRGLFQRIFALTVFPPIGVAAYVLARRCYGFGMSRSRSNRQALRRPRSKPPRSATRRKTGLADLREQPFHLRRRVPVAPLVGQGDALLEDRAGLVDFAGIEVRLAELLVAATVSSGWSAISERSRWRPSSRSPSRRHWTARP